MYSVIDYKFRRCFAVIDADNVDELCTRYGIAQTQLEKTVAFPCKKSGWYISEKDKYFEKSVKRYLSAFGEKPRFARVRGRTAITYYIAYHTSEDATYAELLRK